MAEQVQWSARAGVVKGPQLGATGALAVEAYDKLQVQVPAGADLDVDLSPGVAAAVRCLVILPDLPDPALTYDVGGTAIALDAPTFLVGGAVALAGDPTSLTFTNGTASDAVISILVGRDATP